MKSVKPTTYCKGVVVGTGREAKVRDYAQPIANPILRKKNVTKSQMRSWWSEEALSLRSGKRRPSTGRSTRFLEVEERSFWRGRGGEWRGRGEQVDRVVFV
jgi:hypothetical protein